MDKKTILGAMLAIAACTAFGMVGDGKTPESDSRVRSALNDVGLNYTVDSDGDFRLIHTLADGRTQLVIINSNVSNYMNIEVRDVWACAAEADKDEGFSKREMEKVLRDSARSKIGAWRIAGSRLLYRCEIASTANGDTLKNVIRFVAEKADEMEQEMTNGKDRF